MEANQINDWYLYDGVEISGPFDALALRELQFKDKQDLRRLMVSRPGSERWESLEDHLSNVQHATHSELESVELTKLELEIYLEDSISTLRKIQRELDGFVEGRRILAADGITFGVDAKTESPPSATPIEQLKTLESQLKEPARLPQPTRRTATISASPQYLHLVSRGRLRLGKLQSPIQQGLIFYFFTFGISALYWARNVLSDIYWHKEASFRHHSLWSGLPLVIPGMGALFFLRLLRLLQAASAGQFRPRGVVLKTMLSIVPPLSIFLCCRLVNRYWLQVATKDAGSFSNTE